LGFPHRPGGNQRGLVAVGQRQEAAEQSEGRRDGGAGQVGFDTKVELPVGRACCVNATTAYR
jgi:hypothetical protein